MKYKFYYLFHGLLYGKIGPTCVTDIQKKGIKKANEAILKTYLFIIRIIVKNVVL